MSADRRRRSSRLARSARAAHAIAVLLATTAVAAPHSVAAPVAGPQPADEQVARETARKDDARKNASTPAERDRRLRSRRAFHGLSARDALELASSRHPEFVLLPAWRAPALPLGHRIAGYESDFVARVASPDGEQGHVVMSSVPMRATDDAGENRPVDLSLQSDGHVYRAANPLADVRLSRRLDAGLELPGPGLVIRPVVEAQPEPTLSGDTLFYGNVLTDADLLVRPIVNGFGFQIQIRSEDSPEQYEFDIEVPGDSTLNAEPGAHVIEVRRSGELVAALTAPRAWDADGRAVELQWRLDGGRLGIDVRHRERDYAYPLLVDPDALETFEWERYGVDNAYGNQGGWEYRSDDDFDGLGWRGTYSGRSFGAGLNIGNVGSARYFTMNHSGAWTFRAPGFARMTQVEWNLFDHENNGTCTELGLAEWPVTAETATRWYPGSPSWSNCGTYYNRYSRSPGGGQPGDEAEYQVKASSSGFKGFFLAQVGVVYLYMNDPDGPVLGSGLPDEWVNWGAERKLDVWAVDPSMGIATMTLSAPGWQGAQINADYVRCERFRKCPRAHATDGATGAASVGDMDEGINDLQVTARDGADNRRAATAFTGFPGTTRFTGQGLRGEYYDNPDFTGPKLERLDPQVDFNWGTGTPHSTLGPDTFSVRWAGYVEAPETGTYTFQTSTDDGARLWVGDLTKLEAAIIDDWRVRPETARTGTAYLEAGKKYRLVMEYLEQSSTAVARLRWRLPSRPSSEAPVAVPAARLSPPGGWRLKLDRSGPVLTASGPLWDIRDRPDDHRFEGMYGNSAVVSVVARDGSTTSPATQRSGARSLDFTVKNSAGAIVRSSPDPSPQSCPQGNCERPRDFTFDAGTLPDGTYTIEATATDQLQNSSVLRWTVKLDRAGTIYHAESWTRGPHEGGDLLDEEWADAGAAAARIHGLDHKSTIRPVGCSYDSAGCSQQRLRSIDGETDPAAGDAFITTTGRRRTDPRIIANSDLLEASLDSSTPAATGSLVDLLEPWQSPPSGHASEYRMYEETEQAVIDGDERTVRVRVYVDAATRMLLRQTRQEDGTITNRVLYTYPGQRLVTSEVPSDFFALTRPSNTNYERSNQLGPEGGGGSSPEEPSEAERLESARAFRSQMGFRADDAYVLSLLRDPSLEAIADRWGAPVTAQEQTELELRTDISSARGIVDGYGAHQPAYAGSFFAQQTGMLTVLFTGSLATHEAQLEALFPHPERLRFALATRTLVALSALREQISSDWDAGLLTSFGPASLAVDQELNKVVLGVADADDAELAVLRQRYGSGAEIVREARAEEARFRVPAGYRIFPAPIGTQAPPEGFDCTAGYTAVGRRKRGDTFVRQYFKLTSGHCNDDGVAGPRNGYGDPFMAGGEVFGHWGRNAYPAEGETGETDAGYITLRPGRATSLVFLRRRSERFRYARVAHGSPTPRQGDPYCQMGASKGYFVCGVVDDDDVDYDARGGRKIKHALRIDYDQRCAVLGGDSGGPTWVPSGRSATVIPHGIIAAKANPGLDTICDGEANVRQGYVVPLSRALPELPSAGNPISLFVTE